MSQLTNALRLLATACCIVSAPASAQSQKVPAACQPMIDAQRKSVITPHHTYSTETEAGPGAKGRTLEEISVDGAIYVQMNGKWVKSPMSPNDALQQLNENLTTATALSCQHAGDDAVAGAPAAVFTAHTENEDVKSDARIWVAKASGLILRTEADVDTGGGDKRHVSIRYDYANVRAPGAEK